jgi:hypothetical protein
VRKDALAAMKDGHSPSEAVRIADAMKQMKSSTFDGEDGFNETDDPDWNANEDEGD